MTVAEGSNVVTLDDLTDEAVKAYLGAYEQAFVNTIGKASANKVFGYATGCAAKASPVVQKALQGFVSSYHKAADERTDYDWKVIDIANAKAKVTRHANHAIKATKNGKAGVLNGHIQGEPIEVNGKEPKPEKLDVTDYEAMPMSKKYLLMCERFEFIPSDEICSMLSGYGRQTFYNLRASLKKVGYLFDKAPDGWHIGRKPEVDPKAREIERLRAQLAEVTSHFEAKIAAVLSGKVG